MAISDGSNQQCSLNCLSDSLFYSHRLRIPNIADDVCGECLAAVVETSLSGERVDELREYPCMVVSDNDTKLTSHAILKWQED